ncbi:GntR family transcriptional regulator [Bacillus atrophaeus]|jgi:GntR family transcriptional regulator|uniref:Transcriptional regulator (GntR family) protein n=1 Tax=Bacillus atrophaeus (strain 1942) TaxID=720555 RepID=A0ABM5LU74_BACA1|nr:GntR family transcriptional regulator [Bacillus atrophaeus]AMR63647.1 GntR family transcriptional regulator [Bacillus subtilis subsp. globigii]ADP31381.1 putative transcriptional regulator (GntR family) protein [Bacillus atrophaeus 1942]AIK47280.1 bacterial regulatory s, gntR family protein [Bacillus atrophaeus subsp. globigii]AKL83639.1 YhcF [Bacillus atrophaeus UCMB-5137]ARW05978.1 putative HTH-type transcriptional regulator YhcF [Bacillus atrophaeus]
MKQDFHSSKPIYLQIADQIFFRLVRKELFPGDKLPSVREMAIQTKVNPNTIQRTYSEMERLGIVETRRGQGTFITEKAGIVDELKERLTREVCESFVMQMKELGLTKEEMLEGIEKHAEGGRK